MKIPAAQLKELSRKLRGIGGELFNFDGKLAYSKVDNLDVLVEFPFECAASFAVSAEKFSQVVSRLEGDVDFNVTESKLVLKIKKSKLSLPIAAPRPAIKATPVPMIEVPLESTLTALNFARQACVRSLMQSYSGAVSFSKRYAAGSDGLRLSISETGFGPEDPYILPAQAVEALKIFTAPQLNIGQDQQNTYFIGEDTSLIARRYVKSFPAFEQLIPTSTTLNFGFARLDLVAALKSILPLAEDNSKISLTISESSCTLNLASQQGEGNVEISASGGDVFLPTCISLPLSFVLDFAESVKEDVKLGCSGEKGPYLLESGKFKLIIAGSR